MSFTISLKVNVSFYIYHSNMKYWYSPTDMLNTGGGRRMFHRFDYFNASYSPFGKNDVRVCARRCYCYDCSG